MTDNGIVIGGIPIPSSSPLFLSIIGVHVVAAIVCVIAGVVAMTAPKRVGRHPLAGTIYYWSLFVVFVSMTALSIFRWPEDVHLLLLGLVSFGAASIGRLAIRRQKARQLRLHVVGMSLSYIALLTAFYVDNGPHLPLWSVLPQWVFWTLPTAAGIPPLVRVLINHPLLANSGKTGPPEGDRS